MQTTCSVESAAALEAFSPLQRLWCLSLPHSIKVKHEALSPFNFFGDIPILPRDYTGIFLLWRVKSGGNFWWEKRGKRRHRGNAF